MALLIYKLISTTVVEFLRIGKDKIHLIGLPISDYDKELKSKKKKKTWAQTCAQGCSMQAIKSKEISCGHVDKNPKRFFIGKLSFF